MGEVPLRLLVGLMATHQIEGDLKPHLNEIRRMELLLYTRSLQEVFQAQEVFAPSVSGQWPKVPGKLPAAHPGTLRRRLQRLQLDET